MAVLFFEIVLFLLFVAHKLYKNIYNPATVCLLTWGGLLLAYNLIIFDKPNCRILSDKFYFYILIFLISFSFSNYFINGFYTNTVSPRIKIPVTIKKDKRIEYIGYICFIANVFLILALFKMCGTVNPIKLIARMRYITQYEENTIPIYVTLLMYLFQMTSAFFCYVSLENRKVSKILWFSLFLELVFITLLYVSKGRIIKYMVMFLLLLLVKNKLNVRKMILILAATIGFVYFLTFNRDKYFVNTFTVTDYIFVYFLSPFTAFDMLINGEIPYLNIAFGGRTLGFFYRVGAKIFGNSVPSYGHMFIDVQAPSGMLPTNVYTALGNQYMDFGVFGIIVFGIFAGCTFAILYKFFIDSDNKAMKIFYLLAIYTIVFQFFGEIFFAYLSMTLQDLFCSFLVAKRIRIYKHD